MLRLAGVQIKMGQEIKLHINRYPISKEDATKILLSAAADSTFFIGQAQLDQLPAECTPDPTNSRSGIGGHISDVGDISVIEYRRGIIRIRKLYAADSFYKYCYPYHKEYAILKPLLNTSDVLTDIVETKDQYTK